MLKKRGFTHGKGKGGGVQVELLARRTLGKNASIAVVRVGEQSLVVGVTEHSVTKLGDADLAEIELMDGGTNWTVPTGTSSPSTAWKTMLDQMRARTVRH